MNEIELEILKFSYWEHFKKGKDLALIYPPEHIERIELQEVINNLSERINHNEKETT